VGPNIILLHWIVVSQILDGCTTRGNICDVACDIIVEVLSGIIIICTIVSRPFMYYMCMMAAVI
jgi:hypothetical protein